MLITRLALKSWRNFKAVDVSLRERVFVIGPNASGKSNLLDVLRFLRDVAKPGGGLQRAVAERGGLTKLRCLQARRDPEVSITVELADRVDQPAVWRYTLAFKSEGKGLQRVVVSKELAIDLRQNIERMSRPDKLDAADKERLTETGLEQVNANKDFREIAQFFSALTYLHLVPQLLKHPDLVSAKQLEGDPFGQSFLERIAKTNERTRDSRLKKIEGALRACVPNMSNLRFAHDKVTGHPHLEAMYAHWLRLRATGQAHSATTRARSSLQQTAVSQVPPLLDAASQAPSCRGPAARTSMTLLSVSARRLAVWRWEQPQPATRSSPN